jgi:alpha-tubulin suppressor-like RCC1 family protein
MLLGGLAEVEQVVAGYQHACALGVDRAAYCWGNNQYGQLGAQVPRARDVAVAVPGLANVTRIGVGGYHTCSVGAAVGAVRCWGDNSQGQLGDGTTDGRLSPVSALGLTGAVDVAAGAFHSLAALGASGATGWGRNANGQLGDGTKVLRVLPGAVQGGLVQVIQVRAGSSHSCAVRQTDGTVWCWGDNTYGKLGNGTTTGSVLPVQVIALAGVTRVAVGANGTCAMTATTVHCWGHNTTLGDGSASPSSVPVAVTLPGPPTAITVGDGHACASLDDGSVWCWGSNSYNQLGDGTQTASWPPKQVYLDPASVAPFDDVIDVSAGMLATCVVRGEGTAWCWGDNRYGNLGVGSGVRTHVPRQMVGITGASGIRTGSSHTCVLTTAGTVWCAGDNGSGQLGNGERSAALVPVLVLE